MTENGVTIQWRINGLYVDVEFSESGLSILWDAGNLSEKVFIPIMRTEREKIAAALLGGSDDA